MYLTHQARAGGAATRPQPQPVRLFATAALAVLAAFFALAAPTAVRADTLTVYSARNEQLLKPLLDQFTKSTGTQVQLLTANEGALLARLNAEGASTPADVLITVDAGNLWQAAQQNLLQAVASPVLEKNIPAHLRDPA